MIKRTVQEIADFFDCFITHSENINSIELWEVQPVFKENEWQNRKRAKNEESVLWNISQLVDLENFDDKDLVMPKRKKIV